MFEQEEEADDDPVPHEVNVESGFPGWRALPWRARIALRSSSVLNLDSSFDAGSERVSWNPARFRALDLLSQLASENRARPALGHPWRPASNSCFARDQFLKFLPFGRPFPSLPAPCAPPLFPFVVGPRHVAIEFFGDPFCRACRFGTCAG